VKRPLSLLATMALGALTLAVGAAAPARADETDFDPESTEWNGLSGLLALAAERGHPIEVVRRLDAGTLTPRDAVLVIAPQEEPRASALTDLMRHGGRVLIADDYGAAGAMLRSFRIQRARPRADRDVLELRGNPALLIAHPAQQHPLTVGVDALVTNHPEVVFHDELEPIFEISDRDAVVLAGAVGSGRLVVLSDPSVLINNMLALRGNERFAENLIDYVALDRGELTDGDPGRIVLVPPDGVIVGRFGEPGADEPLAQLRAMLEDAAHADLPPLALRIAAASLAAILLIFGSSVLPRRSPYGSASFAPRPAQVGGFVGRVGWYARSADLTEPLLVYKFELESELHARLGLTGRAALADVVSAMERKGLSKAETTAARALLLELFAIAEHAERNAGSDPVAEARMRTLVARGDALLAAVARERGAAPTMDMDPRGPESRSGTGASG
jgi:hypothetical protein